MQETVVAIGAWVLIISLFCLLIPFGWKENRVRFHMFFPYFILVGYIIYELFIPVEMNIRIDLFLIQPLMLAALFVGAFKWSKLLLLLFQNRAAERKLCQVLIVCAMSSFSILVVIGWVIWAY